MTWAGIIVVALVLIGALVWRRRTLTAKWAWNDVGIHITVGWRLTEIYVAEVRAVFASEAGVTFETTRGELSIDSRWVVPSAITLLTAASGQTRGGVVRALHGKERTELWRGEAGTFRAPTSA